MDMHTICTCDIGAFYMHTVCDIDVLHTICTCDIDTFHIHTVCDIDTFHMHTFLPLSMHCLMELCKTRSEVKPEE